MPRRLLSTLTYVLVVVTMSFRILLVEDDAEIAEFVAQGLREEGYVVEVAADGHDGRHALGAASWDLVILDWWLPGPDGYALLREFREAGKTAPVLFLTARDAVAQRVEGLTAGADDYLCKPFAYEELLARVQALLRRVAGTAGPVWRHHDIVVDPATNRAERAGKPLGLTARELALLVFLLRHPGEVLSRTRLYEQVWEEQYDGLSNTLEVHVMELRKKLEAHGPRVVHTVRGRGYMLGDPQPAGDG
jgi:two-component system copper resistance phosphate regulon response regulator CusR